MNFVQTGAVAALGLLFVLIVIQVGDAIENLLDHRDP